jgi:hypothetical protein
LCRTTGATAIRTERLTMTTTRTNSALLVRVDTGMRTALVLTAQDRNTTISQVVRTALTWWSEAGAACFPPVSPGRRANQREFINVRFSTQEESVITAAANDLGIAYGAVVRGAVRAYLAHIDTDLSSHTPAEGTSLRRAG